MEEKLSKLGVGVDFGTTNSVAAFFDGNELALVDLENAGAVMPSATYIADQDRKKCHRSIYR